MSLSSAAETETAKSPPPDKSRFRFQKLLQPFALERGIATPIVWFLLDWLVLGYRIRLAGGGALDRSAVRHRTRRLPRLLHTQ
jgi:hypothetical protein